MKAIFRKQGQHIISYLYMLKTRTYLIKRLLSEYFKNLVATRPNLDEEISNTVREFESYLLFSDILFHKRNLQKTS